MKQRNNISNELFEVMVIKILTELENKVDESSENFRTSNKNGKYKPNAERDELVTEQKSD